MTLLESRESRLDPTTTNIMSPRERANQRGREAVVETTDQNDKPLTIKAEDIATEPPVLKMPEQSIPTAATGLSAEIESLIKRDQLDRTDEVAQAEKTQSSLLEQLSSQFERIAGRGERVDAIEQQVGLDVARAELDEITSRLESKQLANRREIERIQDAPGLTAAQKNTRITELERRHAREEADIAITQLAKQRRFDSAQSIVDRKVSLLTEDDQNKLDALKFFYTENKDILTTEQQREFQRQLTLEERAYNQKYDEIKRLEDTKFEIVKQAAAANAPASVLEQINKADTVADAYSAAEGYVSGGTEYGFVNVGGRLFRTNKSTGEAEVVEGGGSNFEAETALRKEFTSSREAQNYDDINLAYNSVITGADQPGGIGDQALIRGFVKMTDPGSVVREGEFALSTSGQSLINRIQGKKDSYLQGGVGLTDAERKQIKEVSQTLMQEYVRKYNKKALEFRQNAIRQGADPEYVAELTPTQGIIDPKQAKDGDILVLDGVPYKKQGDKMVEVEMSFNQAGGPKNAVDMIKQEEGFRSQAYQDQAGVWTIGYGATQIDGRPVQPGDTISRQEAERLLATDIARHSTFRNKVSVPLTPSQEAALQSFEFNLGSGIWDGSGILEAVNQGNFATAGRLMQQYVNASGVPSKGLALRRRREANMLLG